VALVLLTERTGFVSNISYFGAMAGRGRVDGGVLWVLWNGKILHTSTFLTLTLDEGECSASHSGHSIPHYPSNKRQGGPHSCSDRFGEKNLLYPPGF
jgi:hypothetical protein